MQHSRRPDAGSQPEPGRTASAAALAGPRAAPMRSFFWGAAIPALRATINARANAFRWQLVPTFGAAPRALLRCGKHGLKTENSLRLSSNQMSMDLGMLFLH